jgi:hypothetical protein
MGECAYCRQPAGWFRSAHASCKEQAQRKDREQSEAVRSFAMQALRKGREITTVIRDRDALISKYGPIQALKPAIVREWGRTVDRYLADGLIDEDEERHLAEIMQAFDLTQQDLDQEGAYAKLVKAAILRDLTAGILPNRFQIEGNLPINLQRGEKVVWAFNEVDYLEDRIRRSTVGRSQGVSIRIAKGVYYRTGAFRGHPVERTERVHVATGQLFLTTKHIYFSSPAKSFRIPYAKIVAFDPYDNGVGITRDAATAKPQIFVTGDGWFTYNLMSNLSQFEGSVC